MDDTNEVIMRLALQEAGLAVEHGNAPFGCVVTDLSGNVILQEHDRVNELNDPTAHGEINAIRTLCRRTKSLILDAYIFYTTSEPCPVCMASMIRTKVQAIYFGAKTESTASLPISADYLASRSLKHRILVNGGILAEEALRQRNALFK